MKNRTQMNSKDIKISVIIPAYNVEDYIKDCLDSVLSQKLKEYEIIIVNDGSTDNTQGIVELYIQNHPTIDIKCLYAEHRGPANARNIAMDIAKGKYISFIDADDRLSANMYEDMYSKAEEEQADLVLCGRVYVFPDGTYDSTWNPVRIDGVTNIFENKKLLPDTSSFVWDKLFNREAILKSGIRFNEEIHYAEDALFIYSFLYFAKRVASVQEPLYYYTIKRKNSITGAMDERMLDEVKACELLTRFYLRTSTFRQFYSELLWICIGFWGRKFYDTHNLECNKEVMCEFVEEFYDFLETYYPEKWKDYIRKYSTKGDKKLYKKNKYRTNVKAVKAYIMIPSKLFRFNKKIERINKRVIDILLHFPQKVKNRITGKEYYETYLNAYKMDSIVKNSILYIANSGDNIACNVYALMKEAYTRGGYKIYVAVKDPKYNQIMLRVAGIKVPLLKMNSDEFQKILATANYLVTNYRLPTYYTKKEGQIILNTWHGTPLKTLGRHMNNGIIDLGNVQSQFLASDYLLYPNEYTRDRMVDAFCLDKLYSHRIIVNGYPRNDVFFDREYETALKKEMGVEDKKIYVYMPTWRGVSVSSTSQDYSEEVNDILHEIDENLDDDVVLYVKMHNLAMKQVKLDSFEHIRPFPEMFEIYYFINIADALITDYSSVFYDFANTKKEILLFTYDKDEYCKERGVYEDIDNLPFKQIDNAIELAQYLNSREPFTPDEKYLDFLSVYCSHDSKNTSTIVNDILFEKNNLIDTSKNKQYNVYLFADPVVTAKTMNEFKLLAKEESPLAVLSTNAVKQDMVDLLKSKEFCKIPILVVQNEHVLSRREQRSFRRKSKWGICTLKVTNAVKREKDRMMPSINIKSIKNCSNDFMFAEIAREFSKQKYRRDKQ